MDVQLPCDQPMTPRETFEHFLTHWSDIQSHLGTLHDRARGRCFEIGVRSGVSTAALLTGLEEHGGHLMSIDSAEHSAPFREHPQWEFYQMNSVSDAESIKRMLPLRLELLFVDGDHSFASVLSDLRNYGERSQRILVHDTDAAEWPGVIEAVAQYIEETKRPVIFHPGSYGLAEIQ